MTIKNIAIAKIISIIKMVTNKVRSKYDVLISDAGGLEPNNVRNAYFNDANIAILNIVKLKIIIKVFVKRPFSSFNQPDFERSRGLTFFYFIIIFIQ
jgi:hypothetical protein